MPTGKSRRQPCQLYFPGHRLHWIQARRSAEQHHRWGTLTSVKGQIITVEYLDRTSAYRNHRARTVLKNASIGDLVRVDERYGVLSVVRDDLRRCFSFSIADAEAPWTPCDYEPLTSASPEALVNRIHTHGGFSVSGAIVCDSIGRG